MSKPSLRVYLLTHHDRRRSGRLLRTWNAFFEGPAPSAYGTSEAEVLSQLEAQLSPEDVMPGSRFLWEEELHTQTISVEVHPQRIHKKRPIIGKAKLPFRVTYVYCKVATGAFRVLVPRFGWSFVVEDLSIARSVLQNALSTAMLGETPRSLFDFRSEGEEQVIEWRPDLGRPGPHAEEEEDLSAFPTLVSVAEELTWQARKGKLPALVDQPPLPLGEGRGEGQSSDPDWTDLLRRTPPASLLLVGGAGVGKTALVTRLAKLFSRWRKAKTPGPRLWRTSADRIIAGMVYLGMWQERCLKLIQELSHEHDYLHVDHLATLLLSQPDESSIGEMLQPAVESGSISLIAEATEEELEHCRRRFPSLVKSFHVVRIPPEAPARMAPLLAQYQELKGSKVKLHPTAFSELVTHLGTFQRESLFPGKGYRFMDWLNHQEQGKARLLYRNDVARWYSRYSGLPVELISDDHTVPVTRIAQALQQKVIGQDEACQRAATVLARFKARLNDPDRPLGTFLFAGPTGVGKTELAKQLTRYLFGAEDRMVRLDMSEYLTPGSAERLLEVGPGVVSLAERVRQQPLSLVLLDEIEKAHPEVFDLLLGILGEGRLTDSRGSLVDFRMTLVAMTTNLGVSESSPAGFGAAGTGADFLRTIRATFRPELFNRLDHVIAFGPLSRPDLLRIVDLELRKVRERMGLVRRNLSLSVHDSAREKLATRGYQPKLGARPLKRVIEESVVGPLSVRIAAEPGLQDQEIAVVAEDQAASLRPGLRSGAILV
jgi:ATP-dependent Clp protease ATP-binding subunit ClpC